MKKIAVVLAGVVLVAALVSLSIAAEMKKGTIKSVDAKSGMVMLMVDGKVMHLTAEKSVDLSALKDGETVEASIEGNKITSIKAEAAAPKKKPRAAVGC